MEIRTLGTVYIQDLTDVFLLNGFCWTFKIDAALRPALLTNSGLTRSVSATVGKKVHFALT